MRRLDERRGVETRGVETPHTHNGSSAKRHRGEGPPRPTMPRDPRPGILSIQQLRPSSNTLWGEMRSSGFDQPEESRRQRSIVQESAVARL